jgi:hypothetical protein
VRVKNRHSTGLLDGVKPIYRLGLVLVALLLVSSGVRHVLSGRTHYYNPWGNLLFAPFLILIGLLLMVAIIVAWVKNK